MNRARWREVITAYPCPVCTAGPGDMCVTYTGRHKGEPHADRARLAADNDWRNPDEATPIECRHCLDDPPRGHRCPSCGRDKYV